jgi:hypothetical protein
MMIIAAIIVTIIEPALLAILVCILQNIYRCLLNIVALIKTKKS